MQPIGNNCLSLWFSFRLCEKDGEKYSFIVHKGEHWSQQTQETGTKKSRQVVVKTKHTDKVISQLSVSLNKLIKNIISTWNRELAEERMGALNYDTDCILRPFHKNNKESRAFRVCQLFCLLLTQSSNIFLDLEVQMTISDQQVDEEIKHSIVLFTSFLKEQEKILGEQEQALG